MTTRGLLVTEDLDALNNRLSLISQNTVDIDTLSKRLAILESQFRSQSDLVAKIDKLEASFNQWKEQINNIKPEPTTQVIEKSLPKPFVTDVPAFLKITNEESLSELLTYHFIVFEEQACGNNVTRLIGSYCRKKYGPFGLQSTNTPIKDMLKGKDITINKTLGSCKFTFEELLRRVPKSSFIYHRDYFNILA